MTEDEKVELLGVVGGLLSALTMFPQTYKVLKQRDANGISVNSLLLNFASSSVSLYYALFKMVPPMIIANAAFILNSSIILWFALGMHKTNSEEEKSHNTPRYRRLE